MNQDREKSIPMTEITWKYINEKVPEYADSLTHLRYSVENQAKKAGKRKNRFRWANHGFSAATIVLSFLATIFAVVANFDPDTHPNLVAAGNSTFVVTALLAAVATFKQILSPDELYLAHLSSKSHLGLLLSEIDSAILRYAETPDGNDKKGDGLIDHDVIDKWADRRDQILMSLTERYLEERSNTKNA